MNLLHVIGARPNFMKAAPVVDACHKQGLSQTIVHTGQHYDYNMSQVFFEQLGLPLPDYNLSIGSGSHAVQTAQVMLHLEPILLSVRPAWVIVYGDINSTLAAALLCAKLPLSVAHVEAGLRSFDWNMPEEVNRVLTDRVSDLLFTPSPDANENLQREGIPAEKICLVGNLMIDTLIKSISMTDCLAREFSYPKYALVTLHRPSNVDDDISLSRIMKALVKICCRVPVIFPVHPRTRKRINSLSESWQTPYLHLIEPQGYLDFLNLERHASLVITDSGGVQEETTFLGVPCLTLRESTERPVTVAMGTNILVGKDTIRLVSEVEAILNGQLQPKQIPPFWDGKSAERIATILATRIRHGDMK